MLDLKRDLSVFSKKLDIIAVTPDAWNQNYFNPKIESSREYSLEEVDHILHRGSVIEQQRLSYNYFLANGSYRRILFYYATLLTYAGLLIPSSYPNGRLSEKNAQKRYFAASNYIDKINLKEIFTRISLRALIYGNYYGVIQELSKDKFTLLDLPVEYCRTRFRGIDGNDIVEFDVKYFDQILEGTIRDEALKSYPKVISNYYKLWKKGKVATTWVLVPTEIGLSFSFYSDARPMFLNTIPATIQYDTAVATENEREQEELRKIIVQKMPHLNDGQLVFEPEEALEMHKGAVNMLKSNKNLSVLTSYADVDAIISRTAADTTNSSLERMQQNIYTNSGVSGQLFAPEGSQSLETSIVNDMSLMMILAQKYERVITKIVNTLFGNSNTVFKYVILPITYYNRSDYITDTLKLATSGYSFLLPALASGLSQSELTDVKYLENNVLKLKDLLIPLSSSYTSSGNDEGGRPALKESDKSDKTVENEDSIDNQ